MGTARWGSSLEWLVDKYRGLGVEFDEIYAWWVGGWVAAGVGGWVVKGGPCLTVWLLS